MDKENQPITSGINHWGLSSCASVLPRIKFGVTGQESSPQSPTISYRRPLGGTHKKKETTQSFANWKKVQNGKNKEFAKSNSDN